MSKRVKIGLIAGGLLALVLLIALLALAPVLGALISFPSMPSAYEAKEYCSCLWVEGRDPASCDDFVYQSVVPSQGHTVDETTKTVTARALWQESRARWVSPRYGCVLEQE